MKQLLSIDVGVKNLAMCALKDAGDKSLLPCISFWRCFDVIDASPGKKKAGRTNAADAPGGTCEAHLRKGKKVCGKPAKGMTAAGKRVCGVHNPKTKHKPQDTQAWAWAMLNAMPAIMDEADGEAGPFGEIVIEQQCATNRKMLLIAHLIFGFLVQRYKNAVPVRFVPAYNKLLAYNGPPVECALKGAYAKRKYLAKRYTESMITTEGTDQQWKIFFDSCRGKQDDIADAYLQGVYVLRGAGRPGGGDGSSPPEKTRKPRKFRLRF
jgi:hypothetical protein